MAHSSCCSDLSAVTILTQCTNTYPAHSGNLSSLLSVFLHTDISPTKVKNSVSLLAVSLLLRSIAGTLCIVYQIHDVCRLACSPLYYNRLSCRAVQPGGGRSLLKWACFFFFHHFKILAEKQGCGCSVSLTQEWQIPITLKSLTQEQQYQPTRHPRASRD